jgi:tRNA pseudouridine13 synthase
VSATLGTLPEHFIVEEIPAYPLSDMGEHVFLWIEKVGLNTTDVAQRLAQVSSTKERDIGYAGMKDKHAITRQWFSLLYKGDDAAQFDLGEGARILAARRHNNKLRTGHLIGNRFTLTLPRATVEDQERARDIAGHIDSHGIANYYGAQRFGYQGKNLSTARRWLKEQVPVESAASQPSQGAEANESSDARDQTSSRREQRGREQRGRGPRTSRFDNKLHPSVIQSEFFNRYTLARLNRPEELLLGEVVRLQGTGTHFVVKDLEAELPRKQSADLILTGAMPGPKTLQAEAAAAELEHSIWEQMGVSAAERNALYQNAPGARRDLRVIPEDLICSTEAEQIVLSFTLPAGGYATQVVREFNEADWMNPRK